MRSSKALVLAAVAALAAPGAAIAQEKSATIDFETLSEGAIVHQVSSGSGISGDPLVGTVGVFGRYIPASPTTNHAVVFDSACEMFGVSSSLNCTGNDSDLFNPALGNTLIVAERLTDANNDGRVDDPDDGAAPGDYLDFDFSTLESGYVDIGSLKIIDNERTGGKVEVFSNGLLVKTVPIPPKPNGVTQTIAIDQDGADRMKVTFAESGAIDGITFRAKPACVPTPDPEGANARGHATGLHVFAPWLRINRTLSQSSSSQSGPGTDSDSDQVLDVDVPDDGSIARVDVLPTTSTSTVDGTSNSAMQTSTAQTAGLDLLDGTVTADVVRTVATAQADGDSSSTSSAGTTFTNLKVLGIAVNVAPNTHIALPKKFGPNSYVRINWVQASTGRPAAGQLSGGTYSADITVTGIHVHVTDLGNQLLDGDRPIDIIVSQSTAHADFPQTEICEGVPRQAVSGHAFIVDLKITDPVFGYVEIPETGGHEHQEFLDVEISDGTTTYAKSSTARSDSKGTLNPGSSEASSYAEIENLCLLPDANGGCTVSANALRSQANSFAYPSPLGAWSNSNGTMFTNLRVMGVDIAVTPQPNTTIEIPGIGFIVLNEQFCDGGAALPLCLGTHASGITVRALRIVVTVPDNPTNIEPGAQIIVSEAHSDALFR